MAYPCYPAQRPGLGYTMLSGEVTEKAIGNLNLVARVFMIPEIVRERSPAVTSKWAVDILPATESLMLAAAPINKTGGSRLAEKWQIGLKT